MLDDAKMQIYHIADGSSASISGLSILLEGECFIGDNRYNVGDFIGFNKVFSEKKNLMKTVNYQKDIEVLVINEASLINTIEIYPETGIDFL